MSGCHRFCRTASCIVGWLSAYRATATTPAAAITAGFSHPWRRAAFPSTQRGLANKTGGSGKVASQAQKSVPAPPGQAAAAPPRPANMSPGCGGSGPHLASGKPCPNPALPPSKSCNNNNCRQKAAEISAQRTKQIAGHLASAAAMSSPYTIRKVGAPNTLEHRVYIEKEGVPLSPFHDIPLFANQEQTILNMVVEIPRWTNAKLEVRAPPPAVCQFATSLSASMLFRVC